MTSGMFAPTGTSLALSPSVKLPVASVFAFTTGAPDSAIAQVSHAGPSTYSASGALGTNTSPLGSGPLPAGSNTLPVSRVTPPPVHTGCAQLPFLQVDC